MKKLAGEEIIKTMNKIIEQLENDKLCLSQKRDNIMNSIYNHLKQNNFIDNEEILYFPKNYQFSEADFTLLFRDVYEYAIDKHKCLIDEDNPFENYHFCLKYEDMNILCRIAWGQGTMMQMRTDLIEDWDNKKSFTYEKYKNNK